ncbi:MAG TPA: arginine--tRNA ligase [Flavobacteriales bacterium]|nr:arginine--tRNA ligase [Flavobacteriales bacterium]
MEQTIQHKIQEAFKQIYNLDIDLPELQATRKDFGGDVTLVVFPYVKQLKRNPKEVAEKIGDYLKQNVPEVADYNVVGGFLNLVIADDYYTNFLNDIYDNEQYGLTPKDQSQKALMVEYSSPNTNKPLHLGHIRNNLLGHSISEIYKATGKPVIKTQIINDRGIHICKSMLAWKKFGNGETPESSGLKGDHLAGKYYVKFDQEYKKQIKDLIEQGRSEEDAKKEAPILLEAQEMLRKWEAKDLEVMALWQKMNGWVYKGFDETYKNLGVSFDKNYYESETYLLGKKVVEEGLEKGIFHKKEDGSVWADLSDEGLDEKLLLRADGTSVYMTQDIGTAIKRFQDFDIDSHIYVVGNEQDYHFQVLFLILKKLGYDWADKLYHLSYGMVELPHGKMKSREGTVVDADDLMAAMTDTAREISQELGKLEGYSDEEKEKLYRIIGLGALKYYILKVDPKRTILFDPQKSIDFQGNTGPFIQYTYARIQSILRKAGDLVNKNYKIDQLYPKEKEVIKQLAAFPQVIKNAAEQQNPGLIANYTYDLVKLYNSFYQSVPILAAENENEKIFRVKLSKKTGETIKNAFNLLGIEVPERM